jgi:N-acetylneuraminic acid mutarotase
MHTSAVGNVYFRKKPQDAVFNPQPLYTAPPKKEWVGLTDEELLDLADMAYVNDLELLQTLQSKLKEKNLTSERNIQTSDTKAAESAQP